MERGKKALTRQAARMVVATAIAVAVMGTGAARAEGPNAVRALPGFQANTLAANDDGSTDSVAIGFSINFFGTTYDHLYVNNNGNVTFDWPMYTYTPFPISSTGVVIIAPYFADVDTRGAGSQLVHYGNDTVNGRPAFGVEWVNVGYFSSHTDKLNSFELILIDRSDVSAGAFDIEFNYDKITWETGDASGGSGGLGGSSSRAGYSNGTDDPSSSFELAGSATNGAFLDGGPNALVAHSLNSSHLGRYLFSVRNRVVATPTNLVAQPAVARTSPLTVTIGSLRATLTRAAGGPVAGEPITFSAGGTTLCTAVTDAAGTATCADAVASARAIVAGSYTATFAGDGALQPSTATGALIV